MQIDGMIINKETVLVEIYYEQLYFEEWQCK